MGSRGRGGAGGRGRGRASLSFNVEQLGLAPGDNLPESVLQPPPLYPPLEFKPAPLLNNDSYESQLNLKSNFLEYFSKSDVFINLKPPKPGNEKILENEHTNGINKVFVVDWSYFPPELKQNATKRNKKNDIHDHVPRKIPKKDIENVNLLLEKLEKKENVKQSEKETEEDVKKKDDEQEGGDGEFEEDDPDEEMDDGTDYNQNYFDNGEGYLDDEDDNLDDGPVF